MTYCFRCKLCPARVEQPSLTAPSCKDGHDDLFMVRDYQAEGVGIGRGVRASRDGTLADQAELFLPTNDEFKGPGDPDGTKGMRKWRESHGPKDDNHNPTWPGEVERTTF